MAYHFDILVEGAVQEEGSSVWIFQQKMQKVVGYDPSILSFGRQEVYEVFLGSSSGSFIVLDHAII